MKDMKFICGMAMGHFTVEKDIQKPIKEKEL
jgi:hypothetical protein